MNTATSEMVIEMMVKPISRVPLSAASKAPALFLHMPEDVLEHDDGVVDHEADRERQASSEMLSIEKPSRYMPPSVAMSEIGTASAGISVAEPAQEQEDDQDHQARSSAPR